MKRLLGLAILAALLMGIPTTHYLLAKPPNPPPGQSKVTICHVGVDDAGNPVAFIKQVPAPALKGHCGHGDYTHIDPPGMPVMAVPVTAATCTTPPVGTTTCVVP